MAPGKQQRGFAAMDRQKQRAIARQGGRSVPNEKRSFSQNHDLAASAGRTGGQNVPDEKRSFSQDRALAAEAGRKGGESRRQASHNGSDDNRDGVMNGTGDSHGVDESNREDGQP